MHTGGKRYLAGPASGVTPQSRPAPTRNPVVFQDFKFFKISSFPNLEFKLHPQFAHTAYFFTTFDRKDIFDDFRKFKSFRAQRGAKFFRFSPKIIGFSMIFAIIN